MHNYGLPLCPEIRFGFLLPVCWGRVQYAYDIKGGRVVVYIVYSKITLFIFFYLIKINVYTHITMERYSTRKKYGLMQIVVKL